MRKLNSRVGTHNLIEEDFESYNEFLRVTGERGYNSWANHRVKEDPNHKDSWCGGDSFTQTKEYLIKGWNKKEEEIKKRISKVNIEGASKATMTKLDVAGFAPCVPNYLMGMPLTMFNGYTDIKKSKVIDIVYDVDFSAGIEPESIVNKGVELLAKIQSLEMNGYRVKLSIIANFAHDYDDNWYVMTLPVKNEHQPLNIARVAFPLAHPGMLRVLAFEWYESLPNAIENSGYGASVHHWSSKERKVYLDHFTEKHQVYLNYYSDLEEVFNNIRKTNERGYNG